MEAAGVCVEGLKKWPERVIRFALCGTAKGRKGDGKDWFVLWEENDR